MHFERITSYCLQETYNTFAGENGFEIALPVALAIATILYCKPFLIHYTKTFQTNSLAFFRVTFLGFGFLLVVLSRPIFNFAKFSCHTGTEQAVAIQWRCLCVGLVIFGIGLLISLAEFVIDKIKKKK